VAIDPVRIIRDYYPPGSAAYDILMRHGEQVAAKALAVADHLEERPVDRTFLYEAAMLHDIGIFRTDTPTLDCHGTEPYIRHGVIGRNLLEARGLERHALVCERHVGVGLSIGDIRRQELPLPERDMRPVTLEEEIVCYADKFFSKIPREKPAMRTIDDIAALLGRHGSAPARRFVRWAQRFDKDGARPDAKGA
jgi:uncharacterized protein